MEFVPRGPERWKHQQEGLRKMLACKGTGALLFEPGCGKTIPSLDMMSILTLWRAEHGEGETRVLVVAPLAAVDNWVIQSAKYVAEGIAVWAEVLGGTNLQKVQALASRAGKPYRGTIPSAKVDPRGLGVRRAIARYSSVPGAKSPGELPEPRLLIEVIGMEALSRRDIRGSRTIADMVLESVRRYGPDLVLVDESHKIKGASSNVSALMTRIGRIVPRRMILTGTVMPVGPLDVYAQWRFLDPSAFGELQPDGTRADATWAQFKERFANMGGFYGKTPISYKNLDELHRIMGERSHVALKKDCLDLPPVTPVVVPVNLSDKEKRAYDDLRSKAASTVLDNGTTVTAHGALPKAMMLRQVTSGFVNSGGALENLGTSKVDTMLSVIRDTLAGEKRIVVFCEFLEELHRLRTALSKDKGTTVLYVDGSVDARERLEIRTRFGDKEAHPERLVLLAQIRTMSLSVNELVSASHAVFGSLTQRRDDHQQAMDRLNRGGQTLPVTFWFCVAPGTVDEVILQSHRDRTDLESALLRHIIGERSGEIGDILEDPEDAPGSDSEDDA